jgi:uncharacterized repeat protein (TIGR03803 family)
MRVCKRTGVLAALLMVALLCSLGWAQTETTLYDFGWSQGGIQPISGVILDAAGNLYGTTSNGGGDGFGAVYKLSPGTSDWSETTLYSFANGKDGRFPFPGLAMDAAGNLYGMTSYGGSFGWGTVYRLAPTAGGTWKFTLLHAFSGGQGGGIVSSFESTALILDAAGNLYGTSAFGGTYPLSGLVFKLAPTTSGPWTFSVLYDFTGGTDGDYALCRRLTMDALGNIYGTTSAGGAHSTGVVFKLTPSPSGTWTESILYSFNGGKDGAFPNGGLIQDSIGNLYGTTNGGGSQKCYPGCGVVFKLSQFNGVWTETPIYTFTNGESPDGGLISDGAGNLYGTTIGGGEFLYGTVFELSPSAAGGWTLTTLHSFDLSDGYSPYAGLARDSAGNLYGTTAYGGSNYGGVAFEITPAKKN